MLTFLKKWSPVDNSFVDDFFGQVEPDAPDDVPSINLDKAASWLRVKKYNIVQTLKASYVSGIHYTIQKPEEKLPGRGKNTRRRVLLTPDCFKMVCMQSRSPQAARVRDYFVAVEKTLFRYKAEIVDGMRSRIEELERNQRPRAALSASTPGVIYVLRSGTSRVKLGRTGDLAARLRTHGSAMADDIEVLYVYKTDNMREVEACVKAVLKKTQYRKYKEIYEADIGTLKNAIEGCGKLCSKVQRSMKAKVRGGMPHLDHKTYLFFSEG